MTFEVVWEPVAVDLATRFLADDPDGLRDLFEAVDALADEPRPPGASALGTSGLGFESLKLGRVKAASPPLEAALID